MKLTKQIIKDSSIGRKIVIDFYKDDCDPCAALAPVVHELDEEYSDIHVVLVNTNDYDKDFLKKEFGVIAVPNLQFWHNEKRVNMLVMDTSRATVKETFAKFNER